MLGSHTIFFDEPTLACYPKRAFMLALIELAFALLGLGWRKILKIDQPIHALMSDYPDNPGPLPAIKLCNNSPTYNPIQGDGPLGNQYRGRMFHKGNNREELVKTLQSMLAVLGYDLGPSGIDV